MLFSWGAGEYLGAAADFFVMARVARTIGKGAGEDARATAHAKGEGLVAGMVRAR